MKKRARFLILRIPSRPMQTLYGDVPGELARFIPSFDFIVVNLQEMSRDEILAMKEFSLLRNIFLAMKRAWDDNFFREHYRDIVIFVDKNVREEALLMQFELTWFFIQRISSLKTEEFMEIADEQIADLLEVPLVKVQKIRASLRQS